jgi:hypothetical protein
MKAKKKQGEKVLPEKGVTVAILTQILDWGTVTDRNGERRKVELIWELPEQLHQFNEEDGEVPLIVSRKYGNSLGKGSFLADVITGMTGSNLADVLDEEDEYDLENLLGKVCQLNLSIDKNDEGYENVNILSYMPLGKGDKRKFKPHGDLRVLDLDNFDLEVFKALPDWKQKEIAKSPEYKEAVNGQETEEEEQEEKPAKPSKAAPLPAKSGKKASDLLKKGKR